MFVNQFKFNPRWSQSNEDHFNQHLDNIRNDIEEEEVNKPENLDEKDDDQPVDDEPIVFQDEEVLDEETSDPVLLKKPETESILPTPLVFSRSSSLTSLNSFDIKSVYSTVESEYSQMTKKNNSQLDDFDIPESPSAPDSSFLRIQRTIHKMKQAECRWKISNDLNSVMSKLVINDSTPKFLQSSPAVVNSTTYGFLKNSNQSRPKFLSNNEDSPKVYTSTRLVPDSPKESVCSRMSDASLPSLIRLDMVTSTHKFNSVLNSNPNFKALFDKLNVSKPDSVQSSSSSSCSSIIPKLNQDPVQDTSILDMTTMPMNTPVGLESVSGFLEENKQEESLYLDLEDFIKENFQPIKDDKIKRVSVHSLDSDLKNTKSGVKRLSGDNLKVSSVDKKMENLRVSRTSVSSPVVKTVNKTATPIVNMTRTAHLRASKVNPKVEKSVPLKTVKPTRPVDRLNESVKNLTIKKETVVKKPTISTTNTNSNQTAKTTKTSTRTSKPPVKSFK